MSKKIKQIYIIGDVSVGKTSLFRSYNNEEFCESCVATM